MAEESGLGLFAKAFGVAAGLIAGAGVAGSVLVGLAALGVVGVPTLGMVACCAGSFGISLAGMAGTSLESIRGMEFLENECALQGKPEECWPAENRACVEQGKPAHCWVPPEHIPPEMKL